jgi:hypothetical protein
VVGVEQCPPLQQDAGDPEQPVGDTAQGTAVLADGTTTLRPVPAGD